MLDVANLGAQSADYYLREVAESREMYYSGHGEAPGRWTGSASARLGLDGMVEPEAFKAMFSGLDPATGEQLGRATSRTNGRPAFDLVFRPVKSVSILWALGSEDIQRAVKDAHDVAVREGLKDLEQAVGTRRGAGGAVRIQGQGLLAAAYDHRQSRAGDPLLHTHVIVANRTQGVDGKWATLDGRDLYYEALGAGAVYEMVYRHHLTRSLGVEWEQNERTGMWEVAGVPDAVIQRFSKRREAIELVQEARESKGESWSPKVAQWVASSTRPGKEHADADVLRERWRTDQSAHGLDVSATVGRADGPDTREVSGHEHAQRELFARLSAPDGLTADKATFSARDVKAAVRLSGVNVASQEATDRLVRAYLSGPDVFPVAVGERKLYTTAELAAVERRLVESAELRRSDTLAVVEPGHVRAALAKVPSIGEDQAQMVRDLTGDGHGVSVAIGRGGTGKTFTLRVAREAWEAAGVKVTGTAPTGIAATELEHAAGIEASTLDSLLGGLESGRARLERGQVLVIDEAGMVGTRKLDEILNRAAQAGAKVVLVGDDKQLQAVCQAGGGFRALRQRLGATELVVNRRQRDPLDRQALELIRDGKGEEALQLYGAGGRLRFTRTQDDADRAMLADWWASFGRGEKAVILTLTREDANRLNDQARQVMRAEGRLGADSFEVGDREFSTGDRIVTRKNWKPLGVANGTRGTVEGFDQARRELLIKTDEGKLVALPRFYLEKPGAGGGPSVNHAYATTTHKTQALTVDRAFVRGGAGLTSEWSYVAMSRVKIEARIYAVDPGRETKDGIDLDAAERPAVHDVIAAGMSRSGAQVLAIDSQERRSLRHLTVAELRAERDRLAGKLEEAPESRSVEARLLQAKRERAEAELAAAEAALAALQDSQEQAGASWWRPGRAKATQEAARVAQGRVEAARKGADRAQERARPVSDHERRRAGWAERNAPELERADAVTRELATRKQLGARALELDPPAYLENEIGRPTVEWGPDRRAAWRDAAERIDAYRGRFKIADQERALGDAPKDLVGRQAYRTVQAAVAKARGEREEAKAVGQDQGIEPERGRGRGRERSIGRDRGDG
jgi:conjugative relaxase-like TrwC/TraI family protein